MKKKGSFFKNLFSEYKNVDWPTKSQVGSHLWTVIVFVFVVSVILSVVDFGLVEFFNYMFGIK